MRRTAWVAVLAAAWCGTAFGQDYQVRNSYWCRMKTTEITPVVAQPPCAGCRTDPLAQPPAGFPAGQPQGTPTTLDARDWKCGRYFSDEKGRYWALMYSAPVSDKPIQLQGWLADYGGRQYFYSNTGRVFLSVPADAIPAVCPPQPQAQAVGQGVVPNVPFGTGLQAAPYPFNGQTTHPRVVPYPGVRIVPYPGVYPH